MKTVTGLFDDYSDASAAVTALEQRGVPSKDISIVSNNADERHGNDSKLPKAQARVPASALPSVVLAAC